jgi:hypothetical protein
MVELIGKVYEVKKGKTKYGKPYTFINFGDWRKDIVKISIWSEGLSEISQKPDDSWIGKWISVSGLMEPPYISKYKYAHLSIAISKNNQLHILSDKDARYRLGTFCGIQEKSSYPENSNQALIEEIRKKDTQRIYQKQSTASSNEAILNKMRNQTIQTNTNKTQNTIQNSTQNTIQNTSLPGLRIIFIILVLIIIFVLIL